MKYLNFLFFQPNHDKITDLYNTSKFNYSIINYLITMNEIKNRAYNKKRLN